MASSYAHVECTTSSATSVIGTSALPIFDTDHGSVVFSSNISSDITWTEDAGTFTFARAGIYHVIVNAITSQVTSDRVQTTTFNLNSAADIYTAGVFIDKDMDPKDHTHQRIISIAAGDILHIKTKTAANTMGIEKGTSITILEVTSGVFASSTVTTAGSNDTTDEFNPFDTDGDGPAFAAAGKIARGVTFTAAAGSMTVPSAGKYLIMINHVFAAGGSTNSNITMLLKEGSNVLLTNAVRLHSTVDPTEHTMCVIEDLAADEVLTFTYNIASGSVIAELGSTFTVYKLEEGSTGHANAAKRGQDLYACVVTNQNGTAGATEVNPFDEDNLTGDADFATRASNGITFAAGTGTFTVSQPGLYFVMHNAILNAASDVVFTSTIKVNGVVKATSNTVHIDSLPDPMNSTLNGFLSLKENDVVTVTIDANTAVNLAEHAGSTLTIFRYYPFTTNESVADGLIDNVFTINTFSQGNLSAQYDRNVDQVPFKQGIRGPISLRGRTTNKASQVEKNKDSY